ncbi:MAG: DUF6288 domain-containing protein [Opitutales bacterium]
MPKKQRSTALFILLATALLATLPATAQRNRDMPNPDLTGGESIPEGARWDLTLGATGLRGWMHSRRLSTTEARQVAVTAVDAGSPADGLFEVGDVLLGVAGKPFSHDPRIELGNALTHAESNASGGKLTLTRWRGGETTEVVLELEVLGDYSPTAPYDCPKSARILELGCEALAARIADPDYKSNAITRSLNALALLASGNPDYLPLLKKEAEWAADFHVDAMATWYYGYVVMFLAEYHMITQDDAVLPSLRRLALNAAEGQSIVGSWGHQFAGGDGRLVGYGMMNAPGLPLSSGLVMARMAGVEDPKIDLAIERSLRMQRFYIGKGAVPYGDHGPWMDHEDNGKSAMAAVLFNLEHEKKGTEFFSRMTLAAHNGERDAGHTGNFWNMAWAMPGVALSGPQATGAWMKEFGAWKFDLARRWDGTFIHQSPPSLRGDHTRGWDATGAYLIAYAMPLQKLLLTGRNPSVIPQLDAAEAEAIIDDGRGWSSLDRLSHYEAMTDGELLKRLGSWSPAVRERVGHALSRRDDPPLEKIIALLHAPDLETRLGACQALARFGSKAAPAVEPLRKTLEADDYWLRVKAAEALAAIGQPAMVALPAMLEMIARKPAADDPRAMEQRFISRAIFQRMLRDDAPLDGIDPDLLNRAIMAGLGNEDGSARGAVSNIFSRLSFEEIKPLLPAIRDAVVNPAPSGIMFADGSRLNGLHVLADHRIREGMALCFVFIDIHRWNKHQRVRECMNALAKYGASAAPMLPQLRQLEKDLAVHPEIERNEGLVRGLVKARAIIQTIESGEPTVELRSLGEL